VLDAGVLTTGFPILKIKGGKGGNIKLTYAEVWFEDGRRSARHCPQTGEIKGYHDVYRCAGHGKEHGYEPFHWRTFRYVRVDIATGPDPLTLLALKYRFTAYPFIRKAAFESSDSSHQKMLAMSDRTIRLCSHETFEDCPYYEQSQYVGDSHNMTPIAGYLFGDWLLAKQAILEFAWSRTYEGIPQTRYPSRVPSLITTQPLIWIKWLYDYWWYTGDRETLQDCFDVVTTSLKWFEKFLNRDGVLEALPYWAYVDGVLEWYVPGEGNITPGWRGVSGLFNLQYAGALKWAAELSEKFGVPAEAERYRTITKQVNASINKMCWLEKEGCYLDRPGGSEMSEITNAWAILSGAAEGERLQRIVERLATGEGLYKSTLQGRFFVFQAMSQAGAFEKAKRLFDHWEQIAATDLTTWPEHPWLPTRSYCHGWSSAPAYLFLAEILGVKPLRPGFAAIRIQPCRWGLKWARGKVPLPQGGEVEVQWSLSEDSCFRMTALWPQDVPAEIILPNGDVRQIESGGRPVELFFRAPR